MSDTENLERWTSYPVLLSDAGYLAQYQYPRGYISTCYIDVCFSRQLICHHLLLLSNVTEII